MNKNNVLNLFFIDFLVFRATAAHHLHQVMTVEVQVAQVAPVTMIVIRVMIRLQMKSDFVTFLCFTKANELCCVILLMT